MNKNLERILIVILGIGFLLSLTFNMYLIFMKKEIVKVVDNQKSQLVCEKKITSDEENIISKYLVDINENGAIKNYKILLINEFSDEEKYKSFKEMKVEDNVVLSYDDSLKQVTRTYEFKNSNESLMWYFNYQKDLEKDGYNCEVK